MSDTPAASPPSLFRRLALVFAWLVAFVILAVLGLYTYINWRGEREWAAFRAEWEQKGEKFEVKDFIPPSIPADENFAATPLLAAMVAYSKEPGKPLAWNNPQLMDRVSAIGAVMQNPGRRSAPAAGQWPLAMPIDLVQWHQFLVPDSATDITNVQVAARGILQVLKQFDPEFEELTIASARPHSGFPLEYEKGFQMLLPHLAGMRGISQTLRLRALARLGAGDMPGAFSDVKLTLRLSSALRSEPLLISQLVRLALFQQAVQPIWEGVVRHEWSDGELRELQQHLADVDFLEAYGRAMRTERAFGNGAVDDLRLGRISWSNLGDPAESGGGTAMSYVGGFVPAGFFRLNQVTMNRLYQERCLPVFDPQRRIVDIERAKRLDDVPELEEIGLFNIFARMLLPAVSRSASKFAYGQVSADLALTACALERYRLKNGDYPDRLDPLVPGFIERIPSDVITGELPRYRREDGGRFVLYSVGWNQTDDGGNPKASKSRNSTDVNEGDWTWRFPLTP